MLRWILNNFSAELIIIYAIILCSVLSLAIYWLARRLPFQVLFEYFPDNAHFYRILTSASSILFAFTIIILWQTLLSVQDTITKEAGAFSKIIMSSKVFPKEEKNKINHAIGNYLQIVVSQEWVLMREGKYSAEAEKAMNRIDTVLESYTPKGFLEQALYKEALNNFSAAYEARHARLERLESVLPTELYAVILFSMLLLILCGSLMNPKEKSSHIKLMLMVSILLGVNLAVITLFDYPFSGEISVSNKPFTTGLLAQFQSI